MTVHPLFSPHKKEEEHCPKCGAILQIKRGKKGLFLGCSNYPQCDYLKPLQPHSESKILKQLEQICPKCQAHLVLRQGSFGMFIACGHYPECHFVVHEETTHADEHLSCPECKHGQLLPRRGRQGKTFYGCNQFPKCRFTIASQPHKATCPQCQYTICSCKKETEQQITWQCANKACRHIFYTNKEE